MDLKQFVETTLTQIVEGVEAAQRALSGKAVVNPPVILDRSLRPTEQDLNPVQSVEFDVAVTVGESKDGGKGAGLSVWGISAAGEQRRGESHETANRVRFTVNIQLPAPRGARTSSETRRKPGPAFDDPNALVG